MDRENVNPDRVFTIAVEGNIGSGKTTFLQHFAQHRFVDVLTEPVDKWQNVHGHNLLQLMYESPSRHGLTFQSYVQLTMAQLHGKAPSSGNVHMKMMERSVWSSRHCFAENLYKDNGLSDSEFAVLCEWFDFLNLTPDLDVGVDLIIYLQTTPQVAWKRVKERARSEEKVISIDYLTQLHDLHEDWLIHGSPERRDRAPVLVVNADQHILQVPDIYSRHESQIFEALEKYNRMKNKPDILVDTYYKKMEQLEDIVVKNGLKDVTNKVV